jgi:hypothetical protein
LIGLPAQPIERKLAIAGWVLYALSWVTPSLDGRHFGAWAFASTPKWALSLLEGATPSGLAAGGCLLLGWFANFSLLVRWPAVVRPLWMAAPWAPFVLIRLSTPTPPDLLYFYPWASGVALIHGAHFRDCLR